MPPALAQDKEHGRAKPLPPLANPTIRISARNCSPENRARPRTNRAWSLLRPWLHRRRRGCRSTATRGRFGCRANRYWAHPDRSRWSSGSRRRPTRKRAGRAADRRHVAAAQRPMFTGRQQDQAGCRHLADADADRKLSATSAEMSAVDGTRRPARHRSRYLHEPPDGDPRRRAGADRQHLRQRRDQEGAVPRGQGDHDWLQMRPMCGHDYHFTSASNARRAAQCNQPDRHQRGCSAGDSPSGSGFCHPSEPPKCRRSQNADDHGVLPAACKAVLNCQCETWRRSSAGDRNEDLAPPRFIGFGHQRQRANALCRDAGASIKALSDQQIADLSRARNGAGAGRRTERIPSHVLELAKQTRFVSGAADRRAPVRFDEGEAMPLGSKLIEQRPISTGNSPTDGDAESLKASIAALAATQGVLRGPHLKYHLDGVPSQPAADGQICGIARLWWRSIAVTTRSQRPASFAARQAMSAPAISRSTVSPSGCRNSTPPVAQPDHRQFACAAPRSMGATMHRLAGILPSSSCLARPICRPRRRKTLTVFAAASMKNARRRRYRLHREDRLKITISMPQARPSQNRSNRAGVVADTDWMDYAIGRKASTSRRRSICSLNPC